MTLEEMAPSSLGGFVEDRMTLSLGASLSKGGTSVSGLVTLTI